MTTGTPNADFIIGTDGVDSTFGLGGDDAIFGKAGDDALFGGEGNDLLVGGLGNDTLSGGNGFDSVNYKGSAYGLSLSLAAGTATLQDDQGVIAETDTLAGIEGATGTAFRDFMSGDGNANTFYGLQGIDQLWGGGGNDKLYGGADNDFLFGGVGADLLDGGDGQDVAEYFNSAKAVKIDLAANTASGGDAVGDTLVSIEGVLGSGFGDTLTGNAEDNYFSGEEGNDTIKGGGGDDYIVGCEGADTLAGGQGFDVLNYNASASGVTVDLANNTASGGDAEGDVISGFEEISASDFGDTLRGSGGANNLYGFEGGDKLFGRGGADDLYGGEGNDDLNGGAGDDLLVGEQGRDVHTGGSGADTFAFDSLLGMGKTDSTRDVVKDFEAGLDKVYLSTIDANSLADGNQSFDFIGMGAFTGIAGQLRIFADGGDTIAEGDVNGDKQADFQIEFAGSIAFSATDFLL